MKKFLLSTMENVRPTSPKLLFTSFLSGYVLAIVIYSFYRPQVHHLIDSIFN